MKLRTVTITGADDSIEPRKLWELGGEFPFVEWGILFSSDATSIRRRFPSLGWITDLLYLGRTSSWELGVLVAALCECVAVWLG